MNDQIKLINSPIKVICIDTKDAINLIKDGIYYAINLYQYDNETNKRVVIKGLSTYSAEKFKLENDELLINHELFRIIDKYLDSYNINYVGQYIRSRYSSKLIKENEIYYVEKQYSNDYIKVKGIKNKISTYNFCEVSIGEQRALKLNQINGNIIKISRTPNDFESYSEIEKLNIFLKSLTMSLSDINKIENSDTLKIDIKQMILNRLKKYSNIEEFSEKFFNLNIKSIIDKYSKTT